MLKDTLTSRPDRRLIEPSGPLRGRMSVPGDKSISHRAAILGAIAEGTSRIRGFLPGEDCLRTIACLRAMGVPIEGGPSDWKIEGVGLWGLQEPDNVLDVGNSGTTIRLLMGVLAGLDGCVILTGDESIRRRPMGRVIKPLREMGVRLDGRAGGENAPIVVRGGPVRGVHYKSPVASAQVKSAVILAALQAVDETVFIEPGPSRDHTERMLRAMGADIQERAPCELVIRGGRPLAPRDAFIPGDLSSAAFWIVAGLVVPASDLVITRVGLNPSRTGLLEVLKEMGANLLVGNLGEEASEPLGDIRVSHCRLRPVEVSGEQLIRSIDEVPIMALAMACAEGTSEVRDAAELRVKESDRLAASAQVLRALGADIEEKPDGLTIRGPTKWHGGSVDSGGDHRIAMIAAVAARLASEPVEILGTRCTETSYPGFWETQPSEGSRAR